MPALTLHLPEFYHSLWDYIFNLPMGETQIKEMSEEKRIKFDHHMKHWISIDEWNQFDFYVLYNNDYTGIIKFRRY